MSVTMDRHSRILVVSRSFSITGQISQSVAGRESPLNVHTSKLARSVLLRRWSNKSSNTRDGETENFQEHRQSFEGSLADEGFV